MLSPGISQELGDFLGSMLVAFTQVVPPPLSLHSWERNHLGSIDPLVLIDVLRVPKEEVLFHFHEYRNPSLEFMLGECPQIF